MSGVLTRDEVIQAYGEFMSDILANPEEQQRCRNERAKLSGMIGRIDSLGPRAFYELIYSPEHPEVTEREFALIQVCVVARHDYATGQSSIACI